MAQNFLEQLIAEWYEHRGYFVRRNVLVGKRAKGGYECELDVVAFHPHTRHLVQLEPSLDALSWEKREARFRRKFAAGRKYVPDLFSGFKVPKNLEQIAVLMYASTVNVKQIGGGRLLLVPELLREILASLRDTHPARNAVPEHRPILRSLQLVAAYRRELADVLAPG